MSDAISRLNAALEGRYAIERELGEGGMATVYLADDLKHERKVALKVLKPELAAVVGAERFLAEIKTTANLTHPHILPLFDSGEADSFLFYVMPHIEGESLRERIDREKQLGVDDSVAITRKVADALDYAHEHGVVHRDIKPGNILLSERGEPLVADFGIALAVSAAGGGRLTETGLSLGTPHYMSPEQATGDQDVGPATDIYALGCVLFEMLVGEPPFTGGNAQAVLAKILMGDAPAPADTRTSVPANIDAAVRRAVEKIPADRFTTAESFASALSDPGFGHVGEDGVGRRGRVGPWRSATILATLVAIVSLGGLAVTLSRQGPSAPTARFREVLGEGRAVVRGGGIWLDVAPDGQSFVYVGPGPNGDTQLWQRSLGDPDPRPVAGTEGGQSPALSPDGRHVAFQVDGGIRVVPLFGGRPYTLASQGGSPSWGSDGTIYFVRDRVVHRVPEAGGESERVTNPTIGDHQHPDALPEGRGVLLSVVIGTSELPHIGVVSADGGEVKELVSGWRARYAAPGYIAYATRGGALWLAPFDLRSLEVSGPSIPLAEGIDITGATGAQFAVSQTGTLLYVTDGGARWELVWVSRSGEVEQVNPDWTGVFSTPVLSPDGSRVAVTVGGVQGEDVWVMHLARGTRTQVTFSEGGSNTRPSWAPDGTSLLFRSGNALWTKRADGSGDAALLLEEERPVIDGQWSPDGEWLIYRTSSFAPGNGDIFTVRIAEGADPVPLLDTDAVEWQPALSPDGRWLAYSSTESGQSEVYVVAFPDPTVSERTTVSRGGGEAPVWAPSGRELFYRNSQDQMVAVTVETDPDFSVLESRNLFAWEEWRGGGLAGRAHYAVSSDGRFLMLREAAEGASELVLTLNFFDELSERMEGN